MWNSAKDGRVTFKQFGFSRYKGISSKNQKQLERNLMSKKIEILQTQEATQKTLLTNSRNVTESYVSKSYHNNPFR